MQVKNVALLGRLGDVDLRLLRVFQRVVECGGMAPAELDLNIDISTISRHIKDLETRLGLVLCRRGRGGFAVTAEGAQVYEAASRLLSATEDFRGSLHDIHRRLAGDLHVALFEKTASNPQARIHQAVARFAQLAPQATLHVHVGGIGVIERGVLDGQYHIGVIPEHRPSDRLTYEVLFGETMLLYAAPGHPWAQPPGVPRGWDDLREQRLAGLGYHSPNMALTHTHRLVRSANAQDQEAVATLVLSGVYLGFLPDHYAQAFVDQGRLVVVAPDVLRYNCRFSAIARRSPEPSRLTKAFQEALQSVHQGSR
jgi:LysR family transcriptional regulator, transcriptional activator for bauABCD operon